MGGESVAVVLAAGGRQGHVGEGWEREGESRVDVGGRDILAGLIVLKFEVCALCVANPCSAKSRC